MELKFEQTFGYFTAKVNENLMYFIEFDGFAKCYKLLVKYNNVQNHITGGQPFLKLKKIAQEHFDKNYRDIMNLK